MVVYIEHMTIKEWGVLHKKELISGGAGALGIVILAALCFYLPAPKLTDAPGSTKESVVTLHGKAAARVGIAVFDRAGNAIIVVNSDDKGAFTLTNIPVGEGTTELSLRAVASAWRVSFPTRVVIQKDTSAPLLDVTNLNDAIVTGSNTVLSGKAEPSSIVMVNGVKTTVSADGTWTATVALNPGTNTVAVTATDAAGNTTTQTQTIQYTPTAADSQTGTATVATSTTTLSPGSQPGTPSGTATSTPPTTTPTSAPTTATSPTPAPQPVLGITSSAWVSNPSPNNKANETINVSVKDNYGRQVTDASVTANVYFKNGTATYSLRHTGNGVYSVSFKLNDKYVSGYRVGVDTVSRFNGFVSNANTSFTPQ